MVVQLENNFPLGQKFMFKASFLEWNFNFGHEKKLIFFSVVTQEEEVKKKKNKTETKQSRSETKNKSSTKPRSAHIPEVSYWVNAKE